MPNEKKPIDWAEIEADYRGGTSSIRELARWYGVSERAIRKRAEKGGWTRQKSAAGPQSASADPEPQKVYVGTVLTPETTKPEHIIERGRSLAMRMMDELDATTTRLGELEAIIEIATDTADAGKQREALMQAVSLKQRTEVLKNLATAAKTLAETGAATPAGGKKQERQDAAERVAGRGASKFAPPAAPKLAVDNTRR